MITETMIRTLIIDDEKHCSDRLERLIEAHCSDRLAVTGSFDSVETGRSGIARLKPELVFLDVQLGDRNGFDLLRQLPAIEFDLIFTTAYDKYAIQAFKFSAVDYLMKPVDADDLKASVTRLMNKKTASDLPARITAMLKHMQRHDAATEKISIPTASGLEFILITDIIRCESNQNYTVIHTRDRRKLTVAKTLKDFESLLTAHGFMRVHHAHLVNLQDIIRYEKGKGGTLHLTDGSAVAVSSRKKDAFLKRLQRP